MSIFDGLFNFSERKVQEIERRMEGRYIPDEHYPFKASIFINKKKYTSKIENISRSGIRLSVSFNKELLDWGDKLTIFFELENLEFELITKVIYSDEDIVNSNHIFLGLKIDDSNDIHLKEYYQAIFPVVAGRSIKYLHEDSFYDAKNEVYKKTYPSEFDSVLIMWVSKKEDDPDYIRGFEIITNQLIFRGKYENLKLEMFKDTNIYDSLKERISNHNSGIPLNANEKKSAFLFYKWFLLHLSSEFSEEKIRFLKSFNP